MQTLRCFFVCIYLLTLHFHESTETAIQCMDQQGQPVDWFVIYKLPKIIGSGDPLLQQGLGYAYITSTGAQKWTLSSLGINNADSILAKTLKPLYSDKDNTAYVLYNDAPPTLAPKPNKGHTKGVILANNDGGFWLVHSVPLFPQMGTYQYPKNALNNGQSFLCVSLDLENLNKVGRQLQYNQPQIYANSLSKIPADKITELKRAVEGTTVTAAPWHNQLVLKSKRGVDFTSFAKAREWSKELYKDLVAPALMKHLYVNTWHCGVGKLPSDCSGPYKVNNVRSIDLKTTSTTAIGFETTKDHSKWAVSTDSKWICVGDINRMQPQTKRGGGTVCLENAELAANYKNSVKVIEECPTKTTRVTGIECPDIQA